MIGSENGQRAVLWRREDFIHACAQNADHKSDGHAESHIYGISIDTRSLQDGDAYFAIKGDRFDGHAFVPQAFEAGACVCVVSQAWADTQADLDPRCVIVSDDPLNALNRLAIAARERSTAQIIAVTGSVGKTGTKEMLRHVLSGFGQVHASEKSYNNHWGVPLTLARLPQDADFGVFEIGMNHAGEIRQLVQLVRPHIALITIVSAVHIEFFDSVREIARAKAEIFEGLVQDGVAIINGDLEHSNFLKQQAASCGVDHLMTFGEAAHNHVRLQHYHLLADCVTGAVSLKDQDLHLKVSMAGKHVLMNALAVLATLDAFHLDLSKGILLLSEVKAGAGRGAQRQLSFGEGRKAVLLDESYNANPASMRAAFSVLGSYKKSGAKRTLAILGDMLELGVHAQPMHEALADFLAEEKIDLVFCCGDHMKALWSVLPPSMRGAYQPNSTLLLDDVKRALCPDDVVMVKGSLGSDMKRIIDGLIFAFGA